MKILLRHIGNLGDLIFIVPPVLAELKRLHPHSKITFVTAWGYKDKQNRWGKRNQGGHGINLMMTNPHLDQLVHYSSNLLDLDATTCQEEGQSFPTWNEQYYHQQKNSSAYDLVVELDSGLNLDDNPLQKFFREINAAPAARTDYQLYLTAKDREIASFIMTDAPHPRIVLLESLAGASTRSWTTEKTGQLESAIQKIYGSPPLWFGAGYTPDYHGRPLSLRENIALLTYCDLSIGVLSGPLHMAAAVGLPTLALYAEHPLHRAAPAYFFNQYIKDPPKKHRTLLGPSPEPHRAFKYAKEVPCLTPREKRHQHFKSFLKPGTQSTKSSLAVITVEEVLTVLTDMLPPKINYTP